MSYEDRFEAMSDLIWERANEFFFNGDFDEDIVEAIMNGKFDQAVTARANVLQNVPNLDEVFKAYEEAEEAERIQALIDEHEADIEADRIVSQQELEDYCKDSDMDNYYDGSDHDNDFED